MTNWSDLEIHGLVDFDFGVSNGWGISGPRELKRRFFNSAITIRGAKSFGKEWLINPSWQFRSFGTPPGA
jgi:hypothetical protein